MSETDPTGTTENGDTSTALIEELAESFDFSADDWLRRLKETIHQRIDGDWNVKSEICAATLIRASANVDSNTLMRGFLHTGNANFWLNLGIFARLVDAVDFSSKDIAELEESLPPAIYNDMMIGQYLNPIKSWAVRLPVAAEQLLDLMVKPEGTSIRRLHVITLEALGEATSRGNYSRESLDHRIVVSMTASDDLLAGLALAYPSLIASGAASEDDYRKRLTEWISPEASELVAGAAVRSMLPALSLDKRAAFYDDFLRAAAADCRAVVRWSLIKTMRPLADSDSNESRQLLHEVLPTLQLTPITNEGAIGELSWLLFGLAEKHPILVMTFLRGWAERTDDELPLWHSQRFLHVINHISLDILASEAVGWIITSRQLEEIGLRLIVDERRLRSLPPSTIGQLTPVEIEICALVFAWYDHRVEVAHLLASLVKEAVARQDCEHLSPLFEELLIHTMANYPGTAAHLLTAIEEAKTASARELVRRLRRVVTERAGILKSLHELPEFIPSEDRQRVYQRFDRDFRRTIDGAKLDDTGRHPLLSILQKNKVQLLGGRSLLSTAPETFGETQALGLISVETELPLLQVLDPQSEQMRRVALRSRFEPLRQSRGGGFATPAT